MPWTIDRFPPAMQHLSPLVRRKAIDVANAVLIENGEEAAAIRIGIARAKAWALRNDIAFDDARGAESCDDRVLQEVHHPRR